MSQVNQFYKSLNDDFVYFDVLATNYGSSTTNPSPQTQLTFNQTRSVPIINNTGEYNMSITRFSLDTPRLPVLAVQPRDDALFNPVKTVYTIGYEIIDRTTNALIDSSSNSVLWTPEDPNQSAPNAYPGITAKLNYYYCHSYKYFLTMVNKTLTNLIKTALGTAAIRGNLFPPLFSWDEQTQSIVLYCNQLFNEYDTPLAIGDLSGNVTMASSGVPLIRITMNEHLYALFAGFASTFDSITGLYTLKIFNTNYPNEAYRSFLLNYDTPPSVPSGAPQVPFSNTIPVFDESTDSITPPVGSSNYRHLFEGITLIVKSEITGCDLWSPVASIVFTTSLIPIVSNQLSSPVIYKNGIIGNVNQSANFAQVITDFISSEQGMRPNILYNPTAEYRRVQLYGNAPLTNFDISVFWKSKYGEFIPFLLTPGASASIKILFEKKSIKSK
jgi:hypothetical protein